MRNKFSLLIFIISVTINMLLGWQAYAASGTVDSPDTPANTYSYTLQDLYDRLDTGAAGAQTAFTEPSTPPLSGTMHTLNEIMAAAPPLDNAKGATAAYVRSGRTFWGLTSGQWGLITGTGDLSLPKTGQPASAVFVARDDGELQKGFPWPSPRFIIGSGVVTDTLTGLIWLRDARCHGAMDVTWTQAFTLVQELNTSGTMNSNFCGDTSNGGSHQTDWRVPNANEGRSLFHIFYTSPAMPDTEGSGQLTNGAPFFNVGTTNHYWTSTTVAWDTTRALYMRTEYAGMQPRLKSAGAFRDTYVWPVRGGY